MRICSATRLLIDCTSSVSAARGLIPAHATYKVAALTSELAAGSDGWNRTTGSRVMSAMLCH